MRGSEDTNGSGRSLRQGSEDANASQGDVTPGGPRPPPVMTNQEEDHSTSSRRGSLSSLRFSLTGSPMSGRIGSWSSKKRAASSLSRC